jgi:NAD(P)-dependent dehydrogenase (short-subunit alcohol dehydrogenase family)
MKDLTQLFSLEGKKAVIVGGGGGIGAAIAKGFAAFGADTAIASRAIEGLMAAAGSVEAETGRKVRTYQVDVSSEESVRSLVAQTGQEMGTIDILVNSQGLNKKFKTVDMPMDVWDDMFAVNVRGVFLCCKEFGKGMIEQHYGRIINIGSIGARRASTGDISCCYNSSKGAIESMTLALGAGWARYNITVNNINPILTLTPAMVPIFEQEPEKKKAVESRNPMGRMGLPDDCIGMAVFFASEAGAFVTGQTLYPDGGLMILQ